MSGFLVSSSMAISSRGIVYIKPYHARSLLPRGRFYCGGIITICILAPPRSRLGDKVDDDTLL